MTTLHALPIALSDVTYEGLYDPTGHQFVSKQAGTVTTDADGNESAPQMVQTTDGALPTIGARADAAYTGSGSASVVAALKGIYTQLSASPAISGTVTANAGTNLNTSALALETGGNLAAAKTDLDTIRTNTGAFADSTTSGNLTADSGGAPASQTSSNSSAVVLALPGGQAAALFNVTGTWVGTINWYASGDGGATYQLITASASGTAALGTSVTANGVYRANIAGFTHVAAVMHPYTSGTATVRINSSAHTHNVTINNASSLGQATMANSSPVVLASDEVVPVKQSTILIAGVSVTGSGQDVVPSTDVSGYTMALVQFTGTFSMAFQAQGSLDGATFESIPANYLTNYTASNISANLTDPDIMVVPLVGIKYLRIRCISFSSNSSMAATLHLTMNGILPPLTVTKVQTIPYVNGGTSVARFDSAVSTNSTNVKSSAGQVYGGYVGNNSASVDAYVKLYNKASAPTVGTDTPFLVVYVPKGTSTRIIVSDYGLAMGSGIGYGITGGAADTDTTATASHQVTGWLEYF